MAPVVLQQQDSRPARMDGPKTRQRHSRDEWSQRRALIFQYYIQDQRSLEETMDIMKREHGFLAGKRMYKTMIQLWNMKKYNQRQCVQKRPRPPRSTSRMTVVALKTISGNKHASRPGKSSEAAWNENMPTVVDEFAVDDHNDTTELMLDDLDETRGDDDKARPVTEVLPDDELMKTATPCPSETETLPDADSPVPFNLKEKDRPNNLPDTTRLRQIILESDGVVTLDDFRIAADVCKKTIDARPVQPQPLKFEDSPTVADLYSLRRAALAHLKADQAGLAVLEFQVLLEKSKRLLGAAHPLSIAAMGSLAIAIQSQEMYHTSEPLHAQLLQIQYNFHTVEQIYLQQLDSYRVLSLQRSPQALHSIRCLANVYAQNKYLPRELRWPQAIRQQKAAVALSRSIHGPAHRITEECLWHLLRYMKSGDCLEEAGLYYRDLYERSGCEEDLLWYLRASAYIFVLQGRHDEALRRMTKLCMWYEVHRGARNPLTRLLRCYQVALMKKLNLTEPYVTVNRAILSTTPRVPGPHEADETLLQAKANLGLHGARNNNNREAIELFRRALAGYEKLGDIQHVTRLRMYLGVLLKQQTNNATSGPDRNGRNDGDALVAQAEQDLKFMTPASRASLLDVDLLSIKHHLKRHDFEAAERRYRETEDVLRWAFNRGSHPLEPVLGFMRKCADAFARAAAAAGWKRRHPVAERLHAWMTWEDEMRKLEADAESNSNSNSSACSSTGSSAAGTAGTAATTVADSTDVHTQPSSRCPSSVSFDIQDELEQLR